MTQRTTASLLVLLAFGCDADGGGRDDAPRDSTGVIHRTDDAAAAPAGCALLSEAALEQAVGFDVVLNDNSTGNCIATPADGSTSAPTIDFRVEPRLAAFDYVSAQTDATPIAGLGDRAVWATDNETTGSVVAVIDTSAIVVVVGRADGVSAQSRRQAEAVARLLLRRP